jgi:DUF218 domain
VAQTRSRVSRLLFGRGKSDRKKSGWLAGRGSGRRGSGRRGSGHSRFRPRRLLLKAVLALAVLWLAACFLVVAEPSVDRPVRSDAILVLGPPLVDGRLDEALRLAAAGNAGTVVISIGWDKGRQRIAACANDNPAYQVICFEPSPPTTRGEAEELGALAREHHWTSVLVVTSRYHVSRARLILKRCMPGKVRMVATPGDMSLGDWAYQFAYQTGGFTKALLHRSC